MQVRASSSFLTLTAAVLVGCDRGQPLEPAPAALKVVHSRAATTSFATLGKLPPIKGGSHGEAYAVDQAGSVIAGYSWDRDGRMNPVTWTLRNGAWTVTAFPYPATATSAIARAVNDQGVIAGNDLPTASAHAVLWPSTGGFVVVGCGALGQVLAMSSGSRTLVGRSESGSLPTKATLWQPDGCREDLPALVADGSANATAINGDANIVGGAASSAEGLSVPVRWMRTDGVWQIEQLDARPGTVSGANAAGDLVGYVQVPCASASSCNRGVIWYAVGGALELGTLGGGSTTPRAINAAGEVVGLSSLSNGNGTAFFWSQASGMQQLPVTNGAWAFAISGLRPDGTRLVAGAGGKPFSALVWVVR